MDTALGRRVVYRLDALERAGLGRVDTLPYSIKVLLESALRRCDGFVVTEQHVQSLAGYDARNVGEQEIPFMPGRVVLQDFTGIPAVVDLAAMRNAVVDLTGHAQSAKMVNPLVPCDLVIDHSVQVDAYNSPTALTINSQKEFDRNGERYSLLKWAQQAFANFRVVPPGTGIVHQVNLERLAKVVWEGQAGEDTGPPTLYPDSLVGTDSHTTMINGLGVMGWGVGGIEAEAVMLGQPIYMLIPEVVGFKLTGELTQTATATDLVLTITQMLRAHGVVGKFVEFFGPGLDRLPLANRATIANMAPEYGATMGYFPVDEQTTRYLRLTGRDEALVVTVEQYCKSQGLWRDDTRGISYSDELELNLAEVVPSLAGPKRPQDRVAVTDMKSQWHMDLGKTYNKPEAAQAASKQLQAQSTATANPDVDGVEVEYEGQSFCLKHGAVVIAAITSCTNTSNPEVLVAAGLMAQKARQRGLARKPWVKTSLAPGSQVVTEYLQAAGLLEDLEAIGFYNVGYGCTTCIGNSGPLPEPIVNAIAEHDLVAAAVLSGNRNFEGRVNPYTKANYLASPPQVVAYALAGTVNINLVDEPLGTDDSGQVVYLEDIWPTQQQIDDVVSRYVKRHQFVDKYLEVFNGSDQWRAIESATGDLYAWDEASTYVQQPPFFTGLTPQPGTITPIGGARCLVKVTDSVTTDHISPAGAIATDSPAGQYLVDHGVAVSMFNSYGSRRGNDQVMIRGTFANIRVRNQLAPGTEGGWTADYSDRGRAAGGSPSVVSIYDAAMNYKEEGTPLVVLAGKDYGMGSSRDWAAKGKFLLGVRVVIAESFERIHRSNLVGMGVLPLCYQQGQTADSLGLDGSEVFHVVIDDSVQPRQDIAVTAVKSDGVKMQFKTTCRIDTPVEVGYYRHGGILNAVLRQMAQP